MSKAQFLVENLKPGEVYAGLILGKEGQPDYHLVLLPGATTSNWPDALYWAYGLDTLGKSALPTRYESRLLVINIPDSFDTGEWYWTSTQDTFNPNYAWIQLFDDGYQSSCHKSDECRARAIRRIYIED
jgi:hypothetical protein